MKAVFIYIFYIPILFSFFFACTKQESIDFQAYSILTNDELTGIYFENQNLGYAIGGNTWYRGIICKTDDGGQHWKVDSVFDKELFCLSGNQSGVIVGMGIELVIHELTKTENFLHQLKHEGNFKFIRGVSVYNTELILAVNGNGLGSIEKFSIHSDSTKTVLILDHELNTIQCLDSLHWIAAGYGIVLRSKDAGEHWDTLDIIGDQFLDISKMDENSLVLLGVTGSVYITTDKGHTFQKLRSAGIVGNRAPFRAICFMNKRQGIIAGENGNAFITRDGGSEWIQLEGLPDFDIKDIFYDGSLFWLCGSSGTILSLKI